MQKKKPVVAPQKERKVARSQTQGLSNLASAMRKTETTTLKIQELVVERDLKWYEMYMPLSTKEAGKNEHHELNISKMYAKSVF